MHLSATVPIIAPINNSRLANYKNGGILETCLIESDTDNWPIIRGHRLNCFLLLLELLFVSNLARTAKQIKQVGTKMAVHAAEDKSR